MGSKPEWAGARSPRESYNPEAALFQRNRGSYQDEAQHPVSRAAESAALHPPPGAEPLPLSDNDASPRARCSERQARASSHDDAARPLTQQHKHRKRHARPTTTARLPIF